MTTDATPRSHRSRLSLRKTKLHRVHRVALVLAIALVSASCSSTSDVAAGDISTLPTVPESVIESDTSLPTASDTTVVVATSIETSAPATAVAVAGVALGGSCSAPAGEVDADGEVSFVREGRVYLVTPGAVDARCAYDLGGRSIIRLAWSPDSTAALLGSDQVARGEVITASGFLPANADVNWSGPKGKSLLATTATGGLVKRNSGNGARTDLSFLPRHIASTYHPAGKAIISIGETPDPEVVGADVGVYVTTNTGTETRLLVSDESGAVLSEPGFSGSGELLYFLARHGSGSTAQSHVHEFDTRVATIDTMLDVAAPLVQLTTSGVDDSVAVRVGDCEGSSPTDVQFITDRAGPFGSLRDRVPALGEDWLSPVGWLPGKRLAVLVRSVGCDGPATLVVVDLKTLRAQTITDGVSLAATRTVHAIPEELAIPIGLEAAA